jgi:hypothetical protein
MTDQLRIRPAAIINNPIQSTSFAELLTLVSSRFLPTRLLALAYFPSL